jgi:hypothetical protein
MPDYATGKSASFKVFFASKREEGYQLVIAHNPAEATRIVRQRYFERDGIYPIIKKVKLVKEA